MSAENGNARLAQIEQAIENWRKAATAALRVVATRAAECAAVGKVYDRARDAMLLADAELRALVAQHRGGKPVSPVRQERAERRAAETNDECARCGAELAAARGALHDAQKAREQADDSVRFWESQRAAELALTPEQRRQRDLREALDAERVMQR